MEGLFERYVETADLWWRAEELVAGLDRQPDNTDHSAVFRNIVIRYLNALRRRPAALAILAGEIRYINRLTEYLTSIREIETKRLMGLVATRFSVPAGGAEFSRFMIAVYAMTYFILLSQKIRKPIYGIDLMKGEAEWARFEVLLLRAIENSSAPMAEHLAVPSAA